MATDTPAIRSIVAFPSASTGSDLQDQKPRQDAERAADYRLVIEEGARPGMFIYKTVNRVTGEVIRQLPREEVVKLAGNGNYRSGIVADTSV